MNSNRLYINWPLDHAEKNGIIAGSLNYISSNRTGNQTMSLTATDVKKIAHLARLNMSETDVTTYADQLSKILQFVEQMSEEDTTDREPVAHSFDISQRMRPDEVTEINQRASFQAIAPQVEAGLYLVPQVIEG